MRKSYLKGAIITLSFIFVLSLTYSIFMLPSESVLLSPSKFPGSYDVIDMFILITPFVVGILIVVFSFFLIGANLDN